ncbi:hypothetical protein [Sphingomonas sp.]|uniref:hypothetical protein n=1 Tax=Sphingomonas sp. TaxID=28214 RepID=UPI003D6C7D98
MQLPIIEVLSEPINRRGTSKATGNPYDIWTQVAWLYSASEPHPTKFELLVRDGAVLPKGRLTVSSECFFVDRNGRLQVNVERGLATLSATLDGLQQQIKSDKSGAATAAAA